MAGEHPRPHLAEWHRPMTRHPAASTSAAPMTAAGPGRIHLVL